MREHRAVEYESELLAAGKFCDPPRMGDSEGPRLVLTFAVRPDPTTGDP